MREKLHNFVWLPDLFEIFMSYTAISCRIVSFLMLVVSFQDLLKLQKMLSWFQALKHEQRECIFPHHSNQLYSRMTRYFIEPGKCRLLAQIAGHNNLQLIYKEKYFLQGIYIYWLGGLRNSIKNISPGNNKLFILLNWKC